MIVSDNGGDGETARRLPQEWPGVRLLRSEGRLSFAAACNAGVGAGRGDVVVLLNNDVFCRPDWLERLLVPLEEDRSVGSVGCLLLQRGEEAIDSVGLCADRTLAGFPRLAGLPAASSGEAAPRLLGPAGAAAAYRRVAWEQVGGLDESIFAYSEDLDLALRLRAAGWSTALATDAVGVHIGSATHGHRSAWQRRHAGFARGYMLRRYGLLSGPAGARTLATEIAVVIGDALISRDFAALSGRLRGFRHARGAERRPLPADALDSNIDVLSSLRMRRGAYRPRGGGPGRTGRR